MIITSEEKAFIKMVLTSALEYDMRAEDRDTMRFLLGRIEADDQKTCPLCGQTVHNLYLDRNNETMCADCAIDLSIKVSRIM